MFGQQFVGVKWKIDFADKKQIDSFFIESCWKKISEYRCSGSVSFVLIGGNDWCLQMSFEAALIGVFLLCVESFYSIGIESVDDYALEY